MSSIVKPKIRRNYLHSVGWKRSMVCAALLAGSFCSLHAQTTAPATSAEAVPAWQRALGGRKLAFETASIRPSKPGTFTPPNFALSADDSYASTGGRLTADFPLMVYIEFAYKFVQAPSQRRALLATLPKWVESESFTVHAQAEGNPSKDEMRVMMQILLAERFGLRAHFESKMSPALALTLVKPGKTGPQLRPHAEGPSCAAEGKQPDVAQSDGEHKVFPPVCHAFMAHPFENGQFEFGARDTPLSLLISVLPSMEDQGFAVVDQTGLSGTWDFTLHFVPQSKSAPTAGHEGAAAPEGPEFPTALGEQLGLRLKKATLPIDTLVIDHVEEPSPN